MYRSILLLIKKQVIVNIASNILAYTINLLIGLWFAPYLINNLGVAAYGLIPLANSVTSYMSLLSFALNGALGRFLIIDIRNDNKNLANQTFNTALVGSLLISFAAIPLIIFFSINVPRFFKIPPGTEIAAQFLFFYVLISFLISMVDSCFAVSSWAKSRFDLRNGVIIASLVVRTVLIVLIFQFISPSIWQVGFAILISTVIGLLGDFWIWRKLTPELSIAPRLFSRARVSDLFGMGGWMVVNQIGTLLFLNIDLVVANIVLGPEISGEYGTLLLFSTLLRGLSGTVSGVLNPIIISKYADNDMEGMTRFSKQAVRIMNMAISLPVGLLCGLGKPFLEIWLGKEFGNLWLLLFLMVFHLSINLSVLPLFAIQSALNKVKVPGIVTLGMGIVNFFLALFLTIVFKWGEYGIAAAAAITLSAKNVLFTPIYGALIQKIPWHSYISRVIPGLLSTILITAVSFALSVVIKIPNWPEFILIAGAITVFSIICMYYIGLSKEERAYFLKNWVKKGIIPAE
jgi:membrane protein EpsK